MREGSFIFTIWQKNRADDGVPGAGGTCLAPTGAKRRPNRRFDSHHPFGIYKITKKESG